MYAGKKIDDQKKSQLKIVSIRDVHSEHWSSRATHCHWAREGGEVLQAEPSITFSNEQSWKLQVGMSLDHLCPRSSVQWLYTRIWDSQVTDPSKSPSPRWHHSILITRLHPCQSTEFVRHLLVKQPLGVSSCQAESSDQHRNNYRHHGMDGSIGSFPVSPVNFSNEVGNTADIAENTLQPSTWSPLGRDTCMERKLYLQMLVFLLRPYLKKEPQDMT